MTVKSHDVAKDNNIDRCLSIAVHSDCTEHFFKIFTAREVKIGEATTKPQIQIKQRR